MKVQKCFIGHILYGMYCIEYILHTHTLEEKCENTRGVCVTVENV